MESPFRPDVLRDRAALVTGGGSGIGFEIATQLARHGAQVALMGRRREVLDKAVAALRSEGLRDWKCPEKDVDDLPLIDLEAILAATAPPTTLRSAEENKLGEGGFGPVYLGKFDDGQKVAVKTEEDVPEISHHSARGI